MDEAFRVQESFVKAYSSYITSQATAGLHWLTIFPNSKGELLASITEW
jgi:hypothetical protein